MTTALNEETPALLQGVIQPVKILDIFMGKRRRKDYGNIPELAADLRDNGQLQAITVRPPNDEDKSEEDYQGEPWVLVAGGRRIHAAMLLGWETIRAMDRETTDPLTHRVWELQENLQRKEMTFIEIAMAKKEMLEIRRLQNPEITQAEVAKEVGETGANFSRDVAVAEALEKRPELRNASSKKAILRQAKMADHFEARVMREETEGIKLAAGLQDRLVTADARDWLRLFPTGSVDLAIPDLPYGIDFYKQGQKMNASGEDGNLGISEYDDGEAVSQDLFVDLVPQLLRVTRSTGWIVCFMSEANYEFLRDLFEGCCVTHFEYAGKHKAEGCKYVKVEEPRWFWYRPNSQNPPRYPELHAQNMIEHLLVVNRGEGRLMRPCGNVLCYDAEYGERLHAMQKPLDLLKDLISRFCLSGEVVIDPCFGSGAHLAAAADLLMDFRGCEKNPAMLDVARGYVSQHFTGVAPRGMRLAAPEQMDELEEPTDLDDED